MAGEKTLDIGIGTGGSYITKDSPSTLRVGLDIYHSALRLAKRKYPISLVNADAAITQNIRLPFKNGAFKNVEIILPQDDLLFAMTNPKGNFWTEIKRVTSSKVEVVVNTNIFGFESIGGKNMTTLQDPDDMIAKNLERSGFTIREYEKLSPSELLAYDTQNSSMLIQDMQSLGSNVFRIIAKKK